LESIRFPIEGKDKGKQEKFPTKAHPLKTKTEKKNPSFQFLQPFSDPEEA
jgi:hypothetical protein